MSPARIAEFREVLTEIARENAPVTVRQVYYRALSRRFADGEPLIAKTQADYNKIIRALKMLRESGELPWDWITDGTRMMRQPVTYRDMNEALDVLAEQFLIDLSDRAEDHVEVWCESDSIGGVLLPVTDQWRLPLFSTRGQSSITFAHDAAEAAARRKKPTTILYVGDLDPHGIVIRDSLEERYRRYAGDASGRITFRHIAVTPAQVRDLGLESHPMKQPRDQATATVQRRFLMTCAQEGIELGAVWEAESMAANDMRGVLHNAIEREIGYWEDWEDAFERHDRAQRGVAAALSVALRDIQQRGDQA